MCRQIGCPNIATRWSRTGYCGVHRGRAALLWMQKHPPEAPPPVDPIMELPPRERDFLLLERKVRERFPNAGRPFATNKSGYQVIIPIRGGLHA